MARGETSADFKRIMTGVMEGCAEAGMCLAGGDSKIGRSRSLCGTALGWAASPAALRLKNGARPGDDLWVSGALGSCSAAVIALTDGAQYEWARRAVTRPQLPLAQARALNANPVAAGGTDISDGLAADLLDLCRASRLDADVDAGCIPVAVEVAEFAAAMSLPAHAFALTVGGDLQFIATASPSVEEQMKDAGLVKVGEFRPAATGSTLSHDGLLTRLIESGHRDARGLTFAEEIRSMLPPPSINT